MNWKRFCFSTIPSNTITWRMLLIKNYFKSQLWFHLLLLLKRSKIKLGSTLYEPLLTTLWGRQDERKHTRGQLLREYSVWTLAHNFVRSSGRTKAHSGTIKGAEYCFLERTKRARMAFLVYLATELKGNLNTRFPFTSHTDFSYTRNFLFQEYSWQSTFFMTKQMKQ